MTRSLVLVLARSATAPSSCIDDHGIVSWILAGLGGWLLAGLCVAYALGAALGPDDEERLAQDEAFVHGGTTSAAGAFAAEYDRACLTPSAMMALRTLAHAWQLTGSEAAALVGVSEAIWDRIEADAWERTMSQDQMVRVSAIIGLFERLHLLFADAMADRWPRLSNAGPLFGGRTPVEAMVERGVPGMIETRRYVDALHQGC